MMPRYFMQERYSVSPENFFHSVRYSGKHDRTAYWVRDGEVDAGVINSEILRKMHTDGRLRPGDIRIIWTTPPYPDYVWAAHPRLRPAIREKIQQAFLQLAEDDPQHGAILSNLGSSGFYPASVENFRSLKQIMTKQGVL
jgi:phosphonate transport system substrate-binding protein